MAHLPNEVHRLFAQQHGVAANDTAARVPHRRADRAVRSERLDRRRPTRRLPHTKRGRSTNSADVRPCASDGRTLPIAGPTAGRLWGFRRLPADRRIHVVGTSGVSKPVSATWVVAYRTSAIRERDVLHRADGIRITSRARTALDLARSVTPDDLLSIIEQAMHDGNLSNDEMVSVATDFRSTKATMARHLPSAVRTPSLRSTSGVSP